MYSKNEMWQIVGDDVNPVEFLSNLSNKSLILITADHMEYRLPYRELEGRITPGTVVLDVYGVWQQHRERLADEGVSYTVLGEKGWIAKVQ